MRNIENLQSLGLTQHEARVYDALVTLKSAKVATVAAAAGLPVQHVYLALRRLVGRGMVSSSYGKARIYAAVAPRVALAELYRTEREQVKEHRALIRRLNKQYGNNNCTVPSSFIEVLRTGTGVPVSQLEDRARSIRRAETEVLFMTRAHSAHLSRPELRRVLGLLDRAEIAALKRGVRCRCVYQADFLDDPGERERERVVLKAGEETRVVDRLPMGFTMVDRRIVWFKPDTPEERGIYYKVNDARLGELFAQAFEYNWERGRDVVEYMARLDQAQGRGPARPTHGDAGRHAPDARGAARGRIRSDAVVMEGE